MFKKKLSALAAFSIIFSGVMSTAALAAPGNDRQIIPVIVNGQKAKFPDSEPYINTDGRIMVPVRFVSEMLGAKVMWEADTETAIIQFGGKTIYMPVGSKSVTIDGVNEELDTAAEFTDGRTMVPLRFVSEVLDSEVNWDNDAHSVRVTDEKYQAKIAAGEVKLDSWGREYSKNWDAYWLRLTDLEKSGFYDVDYNSSNRKFFETKISRTALGKYYIDQWATHIRKYYEAQLNIDYRTIDAKAFAETLLDNMDGMSNYEKKGQRELIYKYVDWVKENKVITKGYADPENSQVEGDENGVSMRVYLKFMIISARDTAQTFMDNWDVSNQSVSYELKKGVWYGGYSRVVFDTIQANAKFSGYAVRSSENMFSKSAHRYVELK